MSFMFKFSFISHKIQLSTSANSKFATLNFIFSISFFSVKTKNFEKIFLSVFLFEIVLKII